MGQYFEVIKLNIINLYRKGAISIIIGNFATSFLTFFGSIVVVRVMTKTDFGVLAYIENLYGFIYIFIGLGMEHALLRYIILADSIDKKYSIYKFVLKFGTVSNLVIIIIAVIINVFYHYPSEYGDIESILYLYILLLLPQFLVKSDITNYRAFLHNKHFAVASIILSSGIIISKIVGYRVGNIIGIVIFTIAFYLIFAIFTIVSSKKLCFSQAKSTNIERREKKEMIIYAIQYMLTNGIWALFMLINIFMISTMTGNVIDVANYKVAHVFPGAMTILSSTIGLFITPYFVKNSAKAKWIRKKYKQLYYSTALIIGIVVILLILISKPLIIFIYGEQYVDVTNVMRVLLLGAFFNAGLRYTTANVLAAVGKVQYNLRVSAVGIAIQMILDWIMIPRFGILGVAIANVVVYMYMSIALAFFFNKEYKLR